MYFDVLGLIQPTTESLFLGRNLFNSWEEGGYKFNEQKAILVYLQAVSTGEREKWRYFLSAISVPYDH